MSRDFLTIAQANSKLGSNIPGNSISFVTKEQCISAGADASKLTRYPDGNPNKVEIERWIRYISATGNVSDSKF